MKEFLSDPEKFVGDSALSGLPPLDCLPCKRTELEVKGMFPRQYEIQGFCPVTYVDGKKRYSTINSSIKSNISHINAINSNIICILDMRL